MAHYIRRNLPQKFLRSPHYWITWRNVKLIHEHIALSPWRVALRMNEIRTNAADAAATPSRVDSIHSAKAGLTSVF